MHINKYTSLAIASAAALCFSLAGVSDASAATKKLGYNEYKETKLESCAGVKILGKKIKECIKAGKIGGGVNGELQLVTFANAETGALGATLIAQQNFVVNLLGEKITIGAVCTFNSGARTGYDYFLGYSLSTPPIPSVSVVDILLAAITKGAKSTAAKKPPVANTTPTAKANGKGVSSGFAGNVSNADFKKLMSSAAAGCAPKFPDSKVFSGIKSISLFKAGINISLSATDWKIDPNKGKVGVKFNASIKPEAKIGGDKVKACVKAAGQKKCVKLKIPGKSIKKNITIMKKKFNI